MGEKRYAHFGRPRTPEDRAKISKGLKADRELDRQARAIVAVIEEQLNEPQAEPQPKAQL
jgi:hypothetical protein